MRLTNPLSVFMVFAGLLLVAGCSKSEDHAAQSAETSNDSEAASRAAAPPAVVLSRDSAAPPGIDTTAAPGVAFAYRYAFSLPAKAISGVQQRHAVACEKLGPTRCQITGMSYDQPREGEVAARLDLLLSPELARQFAADGITAVEQADGKLDSGSITGDDAGGVIEQSQRQSASLKAELARVERRLIAKGLDKDERAQLVRHADELRGQLGSEQALRADKEASIATTPVSFGYASEGLFGGSDPFGKAAANSFGSAQTLGAFLLTFAGLALPWLLLAALIVMLVRFRTMKQRLSQLSASPPAADPAAP